MMKNKAQTPSKLSFILYENQSAPKYFEISKRYLQALIFGLPLISLTSVILFVSVLLYFKNFKKREEMKEPKIIERLKSENQTLKKQKENYILQTKNLQTKLLTKESYPLGSLTLFKQIPGQIDQTDQTELIIENPTLRKREEKKLTLRFNLANLTKNREKISGYIFVLLKEKGILQYYPANSIPEEKMKIHFNKGEYFATSRFRPVEASFIQTNLSTNLLFKIIIFSNTGDLILKKTIPKKLEF